MKNAFDLTLEEPLFKRGAFRLRTVDVVFLMFITTFAVVARAGFFPQVSGDYTNFLSDWFDAIKNAGGIFGIGLDIGDYTPPYLYILALLTYLPISSLASIKLVSCIFDFILAFTALKTVFHLTKKSTYAIAAYTAVLFCPTVVLNGAAWAQCDAIFTAFLLLSFYAVLKNRPLQCCIWFGIAFSFKLQAIFFAPIFLYLWLRGKVKLRHLFAIPAVFVASVIPAWLAGRDFFDLLFIYFNQAGQYKNLSKNAPSIWSLLADTQNSGASLFGVMLAGTVVLLFLYWLWNAHKSPSDDILLGAVLFLLLVIPFLLPHMHERYFFPADIFAILFACKAPRKRFLIPLCTVTGSLLSYLPFLFGKKPVELTVAALFILAAIVLTGKDLLETAPNK